MLYILGFLLPPLILALAGRPVQAAANLAFYACAWIALFYNVFPVFVLWIPAGAHALLAVAEQRTEKRAVAPVQAFKSV